MHFIGQSGIGILFLKQRLVAHCGSSLEGRLASETSNTHHDIWSEIGDDVLHLAAAFHDAEGKLEIFHNIGRSEFALQSCNGQSHNLVPCRRHLFHLHAAFCTDKKDVGIVPTRLNSIGYCHCGENVSTATSSTDDYLHINYRCYCRFLFVPGALPPHFLPIPFPLPRLSPAPLYRKRRQPPTE